MATITTRVLTRGMGSIVCALLLCLLSPGRSLAQGIPFFRNFTSEDYRAHNQNFDIVATGEGTVYAANFEGLLYYDNSQWRIIHTPGITRVTSLFLDSHGTLWTGGYNFIGRLDIDAKGTPQLRSIGRPTAVSGEVVRIWESGGQVLMHVSDGSCYALGDSTVTPVTGITAPPDDPLTRGMETYVNHVERLGDSISAMATNGEGVVFTDGKGQEMFRVTEDNGLCSNNVARLSYDGHGMLWGATDNGIFTIAMPTVYTRFTPTEGLRGEVLSMARLDGTVYVGTSAGLYIQKGKRFVPVKEISLACWQLLLQGDRLLAATADGLYAIGKTQMVDFITTANTLSVLDNGDGSLYTGEMDGIYLNGKGGKREKVFDEEKVVRLMRDGQGTLWMQNLYGRVWLSEQGKKPVPYTGRGGSDDIQTLVGYGGRVLPVAVGAKEPFPYPLFSYADKEGLLWLTNNKGKNIYAMRGDKRDEHMSAVVYPLMDYSVRAMMRTGSHLWMGGDKGAIVVDLGHTDINMEQMPRLAIRSVYLHGDSILWGGYGPKPNVLPTLASSDRHVVFHYAIDHPSLLLETQYRTRLNGGNWSAWETYTFEEYSNLTYGEYRFDVQARDAYGQMSEIVGMDFQIMAPFYMRWYMQLVYVVLLMAAVYAMMRYRLYRLEKDKRRLETVVQERTADLVEAQHELVRQEKMATVGKLTQGLIDRILNPLNYINNFAKLSETLVGDALANIEDEKDNMTPDTYDDTIEVLGMLRGNLQKVGEHGANTSRILKAMEEMLKDRTGGQTDMSLTEMLRLDEDMLHAYYEKEIADIGIDTPFTLPSSDVRINGNADLLSMTIMSLLRNAVYAVVKKEKRTGGGYRPQVALTMTAAAGQAIITVRDNGIGIESTIIDRIFDPFFTTKTTGEASGVGLYISREIAQNHGGDITVSSEKGVFTEFTITLPLKSH